MSEEEVHLSFIVDKKKVLVEKNKNKNVDKENNKSNKNKSVRKSIGPSITKNNVEKHDSNYLNDIRDDEDNDEQIINCVKIVKMYIIRDNISKNVPSILLDNVSFNFKENVVKWKFVYHRRLTPEREPSIHT